MSNHIEHHLFPTIPSYRLRRIEREVEALCYKHQIPYIRYQFFRGLWMSTKNICKNSLPDFIREKYIPDSLPAKVSFGESIV